MLYWEIIQAIITKREDAEMAIKTLKLLHVGPFRPRPAEDASHEPVGTWAGYDLEIDFHEQVNLLIGPNNVGKSTVLQSLAAVIAGFAFDAELPRSFLSAMDDIKANGEQPEAEFSLYWNGPIGDYRNLSGIFSFHMSDSAAFLKIGGLDGVQEIQGEDIDWVALGKEFGYVDFHTPNRNESTYLIVRPNSNSTGEDDRSVYKAIDLKSSGTQFEQSVAVEVGRVVSEITTGFRVEMDVEVFEDNGNPRYGEWREGQNKFDTIDGAVSFPELSQGTRSVFDWVSQFMLGMAAHCKDATDWKRRPGIFIIDEIDAHLHPSWQRRIIPTLQRHFPNVQIFASTHSPMMVAGLKAGQVHLLKRDETGQVVWSRNEQDIIGWTADEIYRTFMGIDDPTDELTVQRANRLRELRDRVSRTEAEEDEMNALRRQVNQDLLAKGPVTPQNERYAELMHRFLISLESELSQDGA